MIHTTGGKAGCRGDVLHPSLEIKGLHVCNRVSQRGRVKTALILISSITEREAMFNMHWIKSEVRGLSEEVYTENKPKDVKPVAEASVI